MEQINVSILDKISSFNIDLILGVLDNKDLLEDDLKLPKNNFPKNISTKKYLPPERHYEQINFGINSSLPMHHQYQ